MGTGMTVRRAVTVNGIAGYITDIAVLFNSRNYVRELMENALYLYEGKYDSSSIREITSFYVQLEKVISEKGRLLTQITRASRLWDSFIFTFFNKGTMYGTMELNFKPRAVEFYINVLQPALQGQLAQR